MFVRHNKYCDIIYWLQNINQKEDKIRRAFNENKQKSVQFKTKRHILAARDTLKSKE